MSAFFSPTKTDSDNDISFDFENDENSLNGGNVKKGTRQYKIISIEGNIGSGKTTLLNNLKEIYKNSEKVIFVPEPVDDWAEVKDSEGITMLEKFYSDQHRWGFSFQIMAYISRLTLLRNTIKKHPNSIIITERSLYTDKYVFAKMLYEQGKIEDVNYQIYKRWFYAFIDEVPLEKVIYVKTDPNICYMRIAKRSRQGESVIPLSYLEECHSYHEDMLDRTQVSVCCNNQLILDGNMDIYEDTNYLDEMIQKVKSYIVSP